MKLFSILFILGSLFLGCANRNNERNTLTSRIQYDVTIKSPDQALDWWVQNLEGMTREEFVKDLMEVALSGKVRAYDAFLYTRLSPDLVRRIGSRTDTIRLQRAEPPYNYYDTVVSRSMSIHDITRIRFLEEWQVNPMNMQITKKVLGIAPMLENYDETGTFRGYQPMFWIFYDNRYPAALQGKIL